MEQTRGTMKIRYVDVLVTAGLAAAGSGALAQTAEEFLAAGREAHNSGDLIGAMAAYREAAVGGSAEAQVWLAWFLDHAEENAEAVSWYSAAAEQGDAGGMAGLAEMYAKGEGVERDPVRARQLFEQAAEAGHVRSMTVLAAAWEAGGLGLAADESRSGEWLLRAAREGDIRSMERVAAAYESGALGLAADKTQADYWSRAAREARESQQEQE